MTLFEAQSLTDLTNFPAHAACLGLFKRPVQENSDGFFKALSHQPFRVSGKVRKKWARKDITIIVSEIVPAARQADPFYSIWTADMSEVCQAICDMLKVETVRFRLDSHRSCRRYHLDNISIRSVVTYSGLGTEYILNEGADRTAYENGAENEDIVIDPSAVRIIDPWHVATIRGGTEGLLHKTPEAALTQPSVFMRIDPLS